VNLSLPPAVVTCEDAQRGDEQVTTPETGAAGHDFGARKRYDLKRPETKGTLETLDNDRHVSPAAEPREIASLLGRIQKGDREAFMTIVRLYQQKVFVMAFSILRNKEDALDAVQETFLRLYQKSGAYRPGRNFQAWLLEIAKNISIDYYRKHRQKGREWETVRPLDEIPVAVEDRSSDSRDSDLRSAFSRCVEKLAAKQKMVFVMRHYNELQFHEISDALRISVGTAKSLHWKAVQNMKKMLTPYLGMER
jgi:RNA polymerase sigma-70 factor (ECF subfamily)